MNLTLFRKTEINNTVLGELHINDKFFCYTLEDKIRDVKIKHQTCIPQGEYKIIMTLSQRFKTILPLLLNVPNFEGIRIHAGNTTEDTSGCLLVGTAINGEKLLHSKVALQELIKKFNVAIKAKDQIVIKIVNPEKPVEVKIEKTIPEIPVVVSEPEIIKTETVQLTNNTFKQILQWILNFISKNW